MLTTVCRAGRGAWLSACLSPSPSPGDVEAALRHAYHAARRQAIGLAMNEAGALVACCWIEDFQGEAPPALVLQLKQFASVWQQVITPVTRPSPTAGRHSLENRIRHAILQKR
jgi:hypothetical protein